MPLSRQTGLRLEEPMIRLVFTDMDGTLLDENHQIPQEFDSVIERVIDKGVIFAPSSGRQYYALTRDFAKYEDKFLFLAENGTFVVYKGKEIYSCPLGMNWTKQIMATVDSLPSHVYPVACGKKMAYVRREWEPYMERARKYFERYAYVDDFDHIDDEILKVAICDPEAADAENTILPYMAEKYRPDLQVVLSGKYWVDLMHPDINKGMAAREVQKQLGVSFEECACFGDYLNDEQLMGAVYYSYAMENAHPDVKKVARFIAKSNADHGVLRELEAMLDKGLI